MAETLTKKGLPIREDGESALKYASRIETHPMAQQIFRFKRRELEQRVRKFKSRWIRKHGNVRASVIAYNFDAKMYKMKQVWRLLGIYEDPRTEMIKNGNTRR